MFSYYSVSSFSELNTNTMRKPTSRRKNALLSGDFSRHLWLNFRKIQAERWYFGYTRNDPPRTICSSPGSETIPLQEIWMYFRHPISRHCSASHRCPMHSVFSCPRLWISRFVQRIPGGLQIQATPGFEGNLSLANVTLILYPIGQGLHYVLSVKNPQITILELFIWFHLRIYYIAEMQLSRWEKIFFRKLLRC